MNLDLHMFAKLQIQKIKTIKSNEMWLILTCKKLFD